MKKLPLDNLTVIEFSHMVMGPSAGLILADLGAKVIKVEPIGGDKTRNLKGSGAGYFAMYNRNKQSICVDVKSHEGREIIKKLAKTADVVIENFRQGALDKLGIGYQELSAINSELIFLSAKGFLHGPYENRTALDEVVQMMGGLAYMTGPSGQPLRAGASVIDVMGGMFGVIAILAALAQRQNTGAGEYVKSSLFESTAFLMGQHIAQGAITGQAAKPMPERISAWAIYDVIDVKDGDKIFLAVVSDSQWIKFCAEFELVEFIANKDLATNAQRVLQREAILDVVAYKFKQISLHDLTLRIEKIGLPYATINRPEDLLVDQHLVESGGLLEVDLGEGKTAQLPALPVEFSDEKFGLRRTIPSVGEHNADVLGDIGYSDEDILMLRKSGVLA